MNALRRYVLHAKLYGVAGVFESAQRDLSPDQLGTLADRLREMDAKWCPPKGLDLADIGSQRPENGGLSVDKPTRTEDRLTSPRCAVCERRLHPTRSTLRYCSERCKKRAYRRRRTAKENA